MVTDPSEIGDLKLLFLDYKGMTDLDSVAFLIVYVLPFLEIY
jgi:hypothetical protein